MPFDIEMTGAEDYQRTVKMALGGYPGTGKTLFSSTAPSAFFVFFREQPRIMSIANRYMPHTKLVNKFDKDGRLTQPVWESLHEVIEYLDSPRGESYETVVIDTGDELFQAMKEGRKAANRGKFAIADWGWIGDMYREVINRIIDLPKHVIVTYHLKSSQEGEDGEIVREIALQGQAKDEVAGWFDIVGVMDSWEEDTEEGKVVHRGILTHTTPKYQFVKDHSGKLPKIFELSEDFVGDFNRLNELVYADVPESNHEVLETVTVDEAKPKPKEKTSAETGVPTPKEVKAKKEAKSDKKVVAEKEEPEPDEKTEDNDEAASEQPAEEPTATEPEAASEEEPAAGEEDEDSADVESDEKTLQQAVDVVTDAFPGSEVEGAAVCEWDEDGETCGVPLVKDKDGTLVPDRDLMDLTQIRFRKHMCREHFTKARKG